MPISLDPDADSAYTVCMLTDSQLTLLSQITNGVHDDILPSIVNAINGRRMILASRKADTFKIGQEVRFNGTCKPSYIRGHRAKIVSIGAKKCKVQMLTGARRFYTGQVVTAPNSILEAM